MFEAIYALFGAQQVEERQVEQQEPLPAGVSWCYSETNERCACDFRESKKITCGYGESYNEEDKK